MSKRGRAYKKAQLNRAKSVLAGEHAPIPMRDLQANYVFEVIPENAQGVNNISAEYYREFILKKVLSVFKFEGMPDNWDLEYLKLNLFMNGMVCITDTTLGVIPLECGVTGINVFNRPTECIIGNPILGELRRLIDTDCALVHLQFDYKGIEPLIRRYSYYLAQCDASLSSTLFNSRVAFIGKASTEAQARTLRNMYSEISSGNPVVIVGDEVADRWEILNVKNSYVGNEILETRRKIVDELLTEIGIFNANTDKKERLITDEVNENNIETQVNVLHWLENIKKGFDVANNLYGLNLSVDIAEEVKNRSTENLPEQEEVVKDEFV